MDNHIETRAGEETVNPSPNPAGGALFFYFNETTDDLVYSDKATYSGDGYTNLGEQTNTAPSTFGSWVFDSKRASIKTVTKDASMSSKIYVLTKMSSMFYNCSALTSLDLSGFDTSSVTNISQMFQGCTSLTSLDLSGFDTSSLTGISSMFFGCTALTSLDLSSFNTSNVTDMTSMFRDCQSLTSLDLSNFDTSNVTYMSEMFRDCQSLTSLDLSGFDTSNARDIYHMFRNCQSLTSLNLSSFDTSKATNTFDIFNNCNNLRIIDISPNMSNTLSSLPANTYYDAVTRQSYTKDTIPGGSTYVRDLADLDLVTTMVQTRMGINKVKGMLKSIVNTVSNETSIIKKGIDVQSVSIDRDYQSIRSSSLYHETVKLSANGITSTSIRILGSIRFSTPNTLYAPYFGVKILLDVNKPDDDRIDLRCSGVVSALTSTGECVCTGTYCGNISTNILYCSMVTVDRDLQASEGIASLLFQ